MTELWDRITDPVTGEPEPLKWFNRFDKFYRPLGPDRSMLQAYVNALEDAGKSLQKRPRAVTSAWRERSRQWNWEARAKAWDEHERQERLRMEDQARREMVQRHIQAAMEVQNLGRIVIQRELLNAKNRLAVTLDLKDARQFVKDGVAMERVARGLPEWLVNITQLSDEELLRKYAELTGDEDEPEDPLSPASDGAAGGAGGDAPPGDGAA